MNTATVWLVVGLDSFDIDGLTEDTDPDYSADFVPIYDDSASADKKVKLGTLLPAGIISPYAGTTAPNGWLLCYGQTIGATGSGADVEDAELETLFDVVKVAYGNTATESFGAGNTVLLPDLRGRVVAGQDDMGGTSANRLTATATNGVDGDTLGNTGGAEGHVLTVTEMPAHTHTYLKTNLNNGTVSGAGSFVNQNGATDNTGSAGSDGSHNNVQPTIILNYIIKT
jgi:microcystin-dependent protein